MATQIHPSVTNLRNPSTNHVKADGVWARYGNAVLGAWLFISSFIWAHSHAAHTNGWVVGILIVASSIAAIASDSLRWVTAALSVWLFISALVISHARVGSVWNSLIVAVIVFALSLVPNVEHPAKSSNLGNPPSRVV